MGFCGNENDGWDMVFKEGYLKKSGKKVWLIFFVNVFLREYDDTLKLIAKHSGT